ncbi:ABC-three component system middle component 6 [uncultured Methanobrevibacter sp.]|uniref:ABC-three component system middle component 6 n=1 Tax=uncultured Methanobrevibacter sp. TaxID=253161 RepID=UPI00261255F8|nr:ABC-three component system middle component 6 [uncultured Methanobrevibacter sp.]
MRELDKKPKQRILDLYSRVKAANGMSFSVFVLSLDWLYLIQAAQLNEKGIIEKCS